MEVCQLYSFSVECDSEMQPFQNCAENTQAPREIFVESTDRKLLVLICPYLLGWGCWKIAFV